MTIRQQREEAWIEYIAIVKPAQKAFNAIRDPARKASRVIQEPAYGIYLAKIKEIDQQEEKKLKVDKKKE